MNLKQKNILPSRKRYEQDTQYSEFKAKREFMKIQDESKEKKVSDC